MKVIADPGCLKCCATQACKGMLGEAPVERDEWFGEVSVTFLNGNERAGNRQYVAIKHTSVCEG